MAPSKPLVSIVLPTYKRDDLLVRCLRKLLTQELTTGSFEIVVVDDAISQTAPGAVASVAADTEIPIVCLPGKSRGPATARNIGWRAAAGEIIAFIDDDAYPADDHWLEHGVAALRRSEAAAATGKVVVPVDDPPTDFQRNVQNLERAAFLTCNAFVRRAVLEQLGGFDERFRVAFREDSDLQFRIERVGRITHAPAAVVIHPGPPGKWGISLKLQRYSMYNALIFKKHPGRYGELQSAPPVNYYLMVVFALAGTLLAFFGPLLLGLALLAVAGGAWFAFCARRINGTRLQPAHVADMVITSAVIPPLAIFWRLRGALKFRVVFV